MHHPTRIGRPRPRTLPPTCAQSAARGGAPTTPSPAPDRRGVLIGLVTSVVVSTPTLATAASDAVATSTPPPASAAQAFSTPEFSIAVPPGFDFAPPPGGAPSSSGPATTAEERGRRGRGAAAPENPVKARFVRPCAVAAGGDGTSPPSSSTTSSCELTIVARSASAIKPTLLQLTDLAQWGTPAEVGRLLLPRGARVTLAATALSVPRPPRDTGTPVGTVETPPLTLYAYEFEVGGGASGGSATRIALTAAARSGRVFVAAAAAPAGEWGRVGAELTQAVRTLRVTQLK